MAVQRALFCVSLLLLPSTQFGFLQPHACGSTLAGAHAHHQFAGVVPTPLSVSHVLYVSYDASLSTVLCMCLCLGVRVLGFMLEHHW